MNNNMNRNLRELWGDLVMMPSLINGNVKLLKDNISEVNTKLEENNGLLTNVKQSLEDLRKRFT
jgi:hypothetical protein